MNICEGGNLPNKLFFFIKVNVSKCGIQKRGSGGSWLYKSSENRAIAESLASHRAKRLRSFWNGKVETDGALKIGNWMPTPARWHVLAHARHVVWAPRGLSTLWANQNEALFCKYSQEAKSSGHFRCHWQRCIKPARRMVNWNWSLWRVVGRAIMGEVQASMVKATVYWWNIW